MKKTYKFKLYKRKQTKHLDPIIDICGEIWNFCIREHRLFYQFEGGFLNKFALQKQITKLKKKSHYSHWNKVPSQAIQDITDRIDRAYKLFFRNIKLGIPTSPPKFKKISRYSSFTLKQAGYALLEKDRKIKIIDKIYPYFQSRLIEGTIKTLTVKRTFLGFYIYLTTDQDIVFPRFDLNRSGNSVVGFDFGLRENKENGSPYSQTFLISSNGNDLEMSLFLRKSLMELSLLQSKYSRKKTRNTRRKLNRCHEKVKNQRKDMHWKLAHGLTNEYDILFFETLNLEEMFEECKKKIYDLGFASFLNILKYLAILKGKLVHQIDQWFPSSKRCNICGWIYEDLKSNETRWVCKNCGMDHNRDRNASFNILEQGREELGLKYPWENLICFSHEKVNKEGASSVGLKEKASAFSPIQESHVL